MANLASGESPTHSARSNSDAVAIVVLSLLLPLLEILRMGIYGQSVKGWLDNGSYVDIAHVIRFGGTITEQHFWGLPACIALLESALSISGFAAIVLISVASSLAASFLLYKLYGPRVLVSFIILCPEWMCLSIMGGSEPLFLCLLAASWLAFRSDRVWVAAILASLATTVRPLGALAVCAFAVTLVLRRDWRRLVITVLVAATIALAYMTWLREATGGSLTNLSLYSKNIWPAGTPFSLPLLRVIRSSVLLVNTAIWTRTVQPFLSMVFVAIGAFALWKHARALIHDYPAEFLFVIGYLAFMLCYNEVNIADFFPRLAIPIFPLMLFGSREWLPKHRFVYWMLFLISAMVASANLVGFRTIFGFSLHS